MRMLLCALQHYGKSLSRQQSRPRQIGSQSESNQRETVVSFLFYSNPFLKKRTLLPLTTYGAKKVFSISLNSPKCESDECVNEMCPPSYNVKKMYVCNIKIEKSIFVICIEKHEKRSLCLKIKYSLFQHISTFLMRLSAIITDSISSLFVNHFLTKKR